MPRILIAGYQHETNTFAPSLADWSAFTRGDSFPAFVRGQAMVDLDGRDRGSGLEDRERERAETRSHLHDPLPRLHAREAADALRERRTLSGHRQRGPRRTSTSRPSPRVRR